MWVKGIIIACLFAASFAKECKHKHNPNLVDPDPMCPDDDEAQKAENGEHAEGDMVMKTKGDGADRNAVIDEYSLWKKSSDGKVYIPYDDSGVDDAVRKVVQSSAASYAKNTCIRFRKKKSGDRDYIKLISVPYACYSSVGRQRGKQDLSLGAGCKYHGTAVHEMMHAVGFLHEQSRPDRDNYISVYKQNVQGGKEFNFDKADSKKYYNIMDYDYDSIMHYGATAFSKNGQVTLKAKKAGATFGQRQGFSKMDIAKINKQYDCKNTGWARPKVACVDNSPTTHCQGWIKNNPGVCKESDLKNFYIGLLYCRKSCNLC